MGGVDKGREGKRLNKCWCNGLVTNYSTINRADAVKLLLAVAEKGGRDWQLVHEMLIDSRAIVLATERGSGFPRHPSLGDTFDGKQDGLSTWALQLCLHRAGKYPNLTGDGSAKYIDLIKKRRSNQEPLWVVTLLRLGNICRGGVYISIGNVCQNRASVTRLFATLLLCNREIRQ